MILYKLRLSVSLIPLFLLFSCSAPPENTVSISLLQSFDTFFQSEESPASVVDLFYSFRRLHNTKDLISVLNKGDSIFLQGEISKPNVNTLIYTSGGNSLRVHQTVFVTCDRRRKLYYSLDGSEWYAMKSHQRKGILNIEYFFPAKTVYEEDTGILRILFQWMADKSETAVPVKMKSKEIISLNEGAIFYGTDEKRNTIDLSEYFLKIPRDTELSYQVLFIGNLINSRSDNIVNRLEIQRDFYIYTTDASDHKLGISLNGQLWNFNIFAFSYDMTEYFQSQSQLVLEYRRVIDISYSK